MDTREASIRVVVPARADLVHVLRSVAASVGAQMAMPLDDVEEIRIAVDEAATLLLRALDRSEEHLDLELTCSDVALSAELTLEGSGPDATPIDVERSWPWRVIAGLMEGASIERTSDGTTIRFRKSIPGSAL